MLGDWTTRKIIRMAANIMVVVVLGASLGACSSGGNKESMNAASDIPAAATGEGKPYELQAEGFEQTPEGTKSDPLATDSPIYVASDNRKAKISLNLSLNKRGDFLLAEGTGELVNGKEKVSFSIDQTSVMHSEKLEEGKTLDFGGLTVNVKEANLVFAFGIRYIPETDELELRLANGEGLVVFGRGETLDSSQGKARIEELEAGHRPRNAE